MAGCAAAALVLRQRTASDLAPPLVRSATGLVGRLATVAFLAATTSWCIAAADGRTPNVLIATVVLAFVATLLRPGAVAEACSARGVQRGWTVRAFHDLEEWRLVGDHLRFRVGGHWLAVRVPRERQPAILEGLRRDAGPKESPRS